MSANKQADWKEREVGALWKKVSDGNKPNYCTGYVTSDELGNKVKQRVIMFSNKNKSNEKSPDFILYASKDQSASHAKTETDSNNLENSTSRMQEDDVPSI